MYNKKILTKFEDFKKLNENKTTDEIYIGGGSVFNEINNLDEDYFLIIKEDDKFKKIGEIHLVPSGHGRFSDFTNMNYHIKQLYLGSFEINEEYRGKGYGEKFLNLLIDKLKEWNIDYLTLYVSVNNIIASKLYKKLGFDFFNEQNYFTYDMSKRTPKDDSRWMVKNMKKDKQ